MFEHYSVLKKETIDGLNIKPDGVYVDCTLGGGGHSFEIASRLGENGLLIGFDQDEDALAAASERLEDFTGRTKLIHANFQQLETKIKELGLDEVDGILFDLGVSSPQLDRGERGFSYQHDAPLDMRMNRQEPLSAYEIVNEWPYASLVSIFFKYGEEKFSKQIARKIEMTREKAPIKTTHELAELIKDSIPAAARRTGGHPAKRVFQALRIAVNNELDVFNDALHQAARMVKVGGRIAVITFHSLEDRIAKQAFKKWSSNLPVPRNLPIVPTDHMAPFKLIDKKAILPDDQELSENRRSRSAKLRVAEKVREWDDKFQYEEGWKKK